MVGNNIKKLSLKHMDDAESKEIVDLIKTHKDVSVSPEPTTRSEEESESSTQ